MFDILAIDWGSKRFGLAFGSSSNGIVLACNYDCFTDNIWQVLDTEISERKVQKIIVGMPTTFDLQKTEISLRVEDFVAVLKTNFPKLNIAEINERNSTKKALLKNSNLKKHSLNHQSAVEILESYFGES